ncbi:peptidase M61 [Aquimarina sp. 2201CG1-2-11]|uniref:M61 family metallopeptidase n=1 Tax=Aquimarina discodermiae TaxID=3231043 RepID=UPI0034630DCC
MQKINRIITILLVVCTFINLVTGCKTLQLGVQGATSPVITQKTVTNTSPIRAYLDLINVVDDKVKVEVQVKIEGPDTINYYMPKIVPGTYQNNNFGNLIEDIKAYDQNGVAIAIQKQSNNHWRITNARKLHKIVYWVNDTFDSEDIHKVFSPTGSNILKDKNFVLNLYAFVGYFDNMKENHYKLFIKYPSHLEASTSAKEMSFGQKPPVSTSKHNSDYFAFDRYADMIDHPIMYSIPNKATFTVNDIEVLLSVYSNSSRHKASTIMRHLENVIRAQKNFLGDVNSTKKYSILLYLASAKADDAKGFGALEHNTSTVVVLPESLSTKKLNPALTDVVSHEFFHIVTPLTIHSKEIHNFDYNEPKMSQHLWLYEGTTEYFSILFQITQGLISKKQFLERIMEKIENAALFDDTMSFTTMSKNILKEPYQKNYRNVYEKGALISMCIDILMREKSSGQYGILDLVKKLSKQFGADKPFEDSEFIKIVEQASYPEISAFLQKHVVNNTPIDYEFYLRKLGVHYTVKNMPSSYFIYQQEPFVKGSEATKEVLFTSDIPFNSFLKKLGIKKGDILLSINQKKYNLKNIYDLFGDSDKWNIGDDIIFKIKREDSILDLTSKVVKPTVEKIILQQDIGAPTEQKALFKKWIDEL